MNTWTACADAWERDLPTLFAITEIPLGQEPPSAPSAMDADFGGILPSSGNLRQGNPLDWRGFRRNGGIRAFFRNLRFISSQCSASWRARFPRTSGFIEPPLVPARQQVLHHRLSLRSGSGPWFVASFCHHHSAF